MSRLQAHRPCCCPCCCPYLCPVDSYMSSSCTSFQDARSFFDPSASFYVDPSLGPTSAAAQRPYDPLHPQGVGQGGLLDAGAGPGAGTGPPAAPSPSYSISVSAPDVAFVLLYSGHPGPVGAAGAEPPSGERAGDERLDLQRHACVQLGLEGLQVSRVLKARRSGGRGEGSSVINNAGRGGRRAG